MRGQGADCVCGVGGDNSALSEIKRTLYEAASRHWANRLGTVRKSHGPHTYSADELGCDVPGCDVPMMYILADRHARLYHTITSTGNNVPMGIYLPDDLITKTMHVYS